MPLISSTFALWRRQRFSVAMSPKRLSLSHGNSILLGAVFMPMNSASCGSVSSAVVSFCASLSPKKVTQTVRVPMSLIGLSASLAGVIIGVDGVTAGAIAGFVIGVGDAASAAFLSG